MKHNVQTATFAGGCFWCTEAIFKRINGVETVVPGYSGGETENPSYYEIHSNNTGHAEAIQIEFDPTVLSYDKLLDVFFATHDPTTKDRQGNDVGSEYRSVVFYHNEEQQRAVMAKIDDLEKSGKFADPIVTEVLPYTAFYEAEDYHQNYYDSKPNAPYCRVVIDPKIQKLMKNFKEEIKKEYK